MTHPLRTEECIAEAAKTHSQTKAAINLRVTSSAVSQAIKKVETQLGTPLFIREHGQLTLTEAGRIYVNGAMAQLSIYNSALRDIEKIRTRRQRQITFVYNSNLLGDITQVLSEFHRKYPDVYVNTVYGTMTKARDYLENGLADFAVTSARTLSGSILDYIPLREDEMMLALPYGHPAAGSFKKHGVQFSLLKNDTFILQQSGSFLNYYADRVFAENYFTPRNFIEISEMETLTDLLKRKQGVGFVPARFPSEGKYLTFSLEPRAKFYLAIACPKHSEISPITRDLMMILLSWYDAYGASEGGLITGKDLLR